MERKVGPCSRPGLRRSDSNYSTDYCNGNYVQQMGRKSRCALTEKDILYWKYVPELFVWQSNADIVPCPLYANYQLVRNVLAACVRTNGSVSPKSGHMILIYDERNPEFRENGLGFISYKEVKNALKVPELIGKISWQRIISHLRESNIMPWLTNHLELKYGF